MFLNNKSWPLKPWELANSFIYNGSERWDSTWYQWVSQFFEGAIEDQEGFLPGMLHL
jgi:hypothetical protein